MKSEVRTVPYNESIPQQGEDDSTNSRHSSKLCSSCGSPGYNKFCDVCGNDLNPKRITLKRMLHEVFHFFTHLDKGFLYTLKSLLIRPGRMQRTYVEGVRSRHQKPFSMFFICLTIAALSRYWIFKSVYAGEPGNESEILFFDKYMVLFHVILLPVNALITYTFFFRSKFNYAEIGVLCLYAISFLLLVSVIITLFKFYWPDMDTAYIELPTVLVYNTITNIHFFNSDKRSTVVLKTMGITICLFIIIQLTEDLVVQNIS